VTREVEALERLGAGHYVSGDRALLPLTVDTATVAGAVGESAWAVYEQTRAGTFPLTPLRLGRKLRWRTNDLLALLGVDDRTQSAGGTA
jgi:hypothetical protein